MKTTKRLVSLVLCFLMIAAIGVPAFAAAPDGSSAQPNGLVHPFDNTWIEITMHDHINVRSSVAMPSDNSNVIGELRINTSVYVYSYAYEYYNNHWWAEISYNGGIGYVANEYLE